MHYIEAKRADLLTSFAGVSFDQLKVRQIGRAHV